MSKAATVYRVIPFLLILSLFLVPVPRASAAEENDCCFAVLSTADMHGRLTEMEVTTGQISNGNMSQVSAAAAAERAVFGDRMILIDNGDGIQGTLITQYAITCCPEEENPMITAMKDIGYDVWVIGNHEFNYTPEQRDIQVRYAMDAGISVLSANIIRTESGENIRGETVTAGEPYYDPFTVKTIRFDDSHSVRVAVIGMSNAATADWDLASNFPGLQFMSLENPEGYLAYEINKQVSVIRENDLADIVIVSAHTGGNTGTDAYSREAQAFYALSGISGVDMMIYGHDHTANIEKQTDADGKQIWLVNGGGTDMTESVFHVTFNDDGTYAGCEISQRLLPLSEAGTDAELNGKLMNWYDRTYEWASAPLASFTGGWNECTGQADGKTNDDIVLSQTALMDLIHKGQIWGSWLSYETEGIEGATVSIASPIFGQTDDGKLSFVPRDGDSISILQLNMLYRYPSNLLVTADMTGEQLWNWMNTVADRIGIGSSGDPVIAEGASVYGLDTFYGIDYEFDITRPAGERVTFAAIDGQDIRGIDSVRVVMNSYRMSGGYGFASATGLTEDDCCWTAEHYLGVDRAPVSSLLGEYAAHMGTVTPGDPVSHGYASTWRIITK